MELYQRAGLAIAADPVAAREAAERQVRITAARQRLDGAVLNAALLRHVDGLDQDQVRTYLEHVALLSPERAAKRLEFIEHPLWRTYVFVYDEGERLLERWLELVPAADRPARFRRLLLEQLTPGAIARDVEVAVAGVRSRAE